MRSEKSLIWDQNQKNLQTLFCTPDRFKWSQKPSHATVPLSLLLYFRYIYFLSFYCYYISDVCTRRGNILGGPRFLLSSYLAPEPSPPSPHVTTLSLLFSIGISSLPINVVEPEPEPEP
jgi:hypothetical protein